MNLRGSGTPTNHGENVDHFDRFPFTFSPRGRCNSDGVRKQRFLRPSVRESSSFVTTFTACAQSSEILRNSSGGDAGKHERISAAEVPARDAIKLVA